MFVLLLLRRLGPRNRIIVGAVLVMIGLAGAAVSAAVAADLIFQGVASAVIGVALCVSGVIARRRAAALAGASDGR